MPIWNILPTRIVRRTNGQDYSRIDWKALTKSKINTLVMTNSEANNSKTITNVNELEPNNSYRHISGESSVKSVVFIQRLVQDGKRLKKRVIYV